VNASPVIVELIDGDNKLLASQKMQVPLPTGKKNPQPLRGRAAYQVSKTPNARLHAAARGRAYPGKRGALIDSGGAGALSLFQFIQHMTN
jgi:hypothetical protein